jgi:hypothetical protein
MTPTEAANHYLYLEATAAPGVAASFAREYENRASPRDFDAYLKAYELHLSH